MVYLLLRHLLKLSAILLLLSICTTSHSEDTPQSLPFCGLTESTAKYIFVSTLDGKITALNPDAGGSVVWSIHPGDEPMLSSSIHKLELTNYGHLVRMIPSLSGGLYKFNGENVEAIPVTADNLLQASFKYSDDLVISGGKERHTYGVSLHSGKVLYECSMKGCDNDSQASDVGDVLVVQRYGQTVRAVEPRTGSERWNFSVAQHDLKLMSECRGVQQSKNNYLLKVIVPEGLICAINAERPSEILWKFKFGSPVVNAWEIKKGKLSDIDLFSGTQPVLSEGLVTPPSLYIGMHDKQLYIQESVTMQRKRQELAHSFGQNLITNEIDFPRIPWKPIAITSKDLELVDGSKNDGSIDEVAQRQTTALSVLYGSSYVDGSGFYLYTEEDIEKSENALCNLTIAPNEKDNYKEEVISPEVDNFIILPLWYWWREVVVISLTTAVVFNLMFTRRFLFWRFKEPPLLGQFEKSTPKESDSGVELEKIQSDPGIPNITDYTSRYLTDFDPVNCLGKGGFGVVFEAKNKIDDCHYAIKRIILPRSKDSRERVMREVKALAKLDHHHIVRYFNAWTECPPPGWQEKQDKDLETLCNSDMFSMSGATSEQNSYVPLKEYQMSSAFESDSLLSGSVKVGDDFSRILRSQISDASDSFIVFEGSSKTENKEEKVQSIIHVPEEDDDSFKTNGCVSSRLERPKCFTTDFNTSPANTFQPRIYLYIQMQLCKRQSLKEWLTINKSRDYKYVLEIFGQILKAVEYVHERGLIHRDLKPSNIFFSLDNQIKVGDFGLVTTMTEGDDCMTPCENVERCVNKEKHTAQVGTQLYMSPEQLLNKPYNYKVDIYSLGLILFELLVPFDTEMERMQVLQNLKNRIFTEEFEKTYEDEFELLKLMLSLSPDERPTTYGIRARRPFLEKNTVEANHFELPMRRDSSKVSRISTSSNESNFDSR